MCATNAVSTRRRSLRKGQKLTSMDVDLYGANNVPKTSSEYDAVTESPKLAG